eukprot:2942291-Pyramimonas_sp.AAC.1
MPPVGQLVAQSKLQDFYAKNACKAHRRPTSAKSQEKEDRQVNEKINFWQLCQKLNVSLKDTEVEKEIDLAVQMGW